MSINDKLHICIPYEVAFYDVDTYRIVWHGSYIKYFELARCALLEKINYTYEDMEKSGYFFPIVDLQIKFIKPLYFRQKVLITAKILNWKHKLIIHYVINDKETGEKITKGSTTQIAVKMPEKIMQFESPIELIQKINDAIAP
jgi:acyl-CoA thioester hydrolase